MTSERVNYRSIGYHVQRENQREEMDGTFVAIPAFVTSAARMRMNSLRQTAGARNVYYQGVDGLIVTQAGFDKLQAAGEIETDAVGKLRLEYVCDNGEIIGCSDYRLADKVVIAGRSSSIEILANGEILQRKFAARDHLFSGKCNNTVMEVLQPWQRRENNSRGTIGPDGWVTPLVVGLDYNTSHERTENGNHV